MKRLLLLFVTFLNAQSLPPDTRALAARMNAAGSEEGVRDLKTARAAFFAWVDLRMKNRATVESLRDELPALTLLRNPYPALTPNL